MMKHIVTGKERLDNSVCCVLLVFKSNDFSGMILVSIQNRHIQNTLCKKSWPFMSMIDSVMIDYQQRLFMNLKPLFFCAQQYKLHVLVAAMLCWNCYGSSSGSIIWIVIRFYIFAWHLNQTSIHPVLGSTAPLQSKITLSLGGWNIWAVVVGNICPSVYPSAHVWQRRFEGFVMTTCHYFSVLSGVRCLKMFSIVNSLCWRRHVLMLSRFVVFLHFHLLTMLHVLCFY